jgi:hypothetical protein
LQDLIAERWRVRSEADFCDECDDDLQDGDVAAEVVSTEPSKCFNGLTKVLQENGYDVMRGVDPKALEINKYHGAHIAIKYGNRKQAGWHIARMEATEKGSVMKLHFEFSNKYEVATWESNFMVSHMTSLPIKICDMQPKKSWLLVQEKPVGVQLLSSVTRYQLHEPLAAPKKNGGFHLVALSLTRPQRAHTRTHHVQKSWLLLCEWHPTRGCLQHTRMSRSLAHMVRPYDAHTQTHTHKSTLTFLTS